MNIRHRITGIAAVFGATLSIAACSTHPVAVAVPAAPAAVSYAPAAYGVQVGSVFDCYYVDDTTEVTNLIAAGLCPPGAIPTLMPLAWHETYASYYGSSAYYNTYIPTTRRTTYINVTVVKFDSTYSKQISTASKNATYKSSNGTTVNGSQLPTGKITFGSGAAPKANLGSGTNGGTSGGSPKTNTTKSSFGSGTSGGSGGKATTGGSGRLGGGTSGGGKTGL